MMIGKREAIDKGYRCSCPFKDDDLVCTCKNRVYVEGALCEDCRCDLHVIYD